MEEGITGLKRGTSRWKKPGAPGVQYVDSQVSLVTGVQGF